MVKKKSSPKIKKPEEEGTKYTRLKASTEELDRIAKLLIRRDLELLETKEELERFLIELQKKNAELQKKNAELEKMNKLMIGRELKMVELKKEIKRLMLICGRDRT